MGNPRSGVPSPAIHKPLVANRFVALDEPPEKALHLRMGINDRIEVLGPSDHHIAPDYRLDSIVGEPVTRENPFTRKAERDDLPAPRGIRLEFRYDAGANEQDFVATRSGFPEWPSGFDVNDAVRHFVEQVGEMGLKARRDKSLAQKHTLRCRLKTPTRHLALSPRH
jgi:hypothetical protein